MATLASLLGRVNLPGSQSRSRTVALGLGGVSVLGLAFAASALRSGILQQERETSVSASRALHSEASGEESRLLDECDCAPLWECMQRGGGKNCSLMETELRACLARQKNLS